MIQERPRIAPEHGRGKFYTIEYAVRADDTVPAREFIEEVKQGTRQLNNMKVVGKSNRRTSGTVNPADVFMNICKVTATRGRPPMRTDYNQLQQGIWEFKAINLRATFYDTDGSGKYTPLMIKKRNSAWPSNPGFDHFLRITTCFEKRGQKTPQREIRYAEKVRKEDLRHDK